MTVCSGKNHEKSTTTKQILKHVKNSETSMLDVRDLMLDIIKQFQKADKVGFSLGLFDKNASFIDTVSWCSIIGKMDHGKDSLDNTSKEHLSNLVNYLEELTSTFTQNVIEPIQKVRDEWMRKVLVWDISIIAIVLLIGAAIFYTLDMGFQWSNYIDLVYWYPFTSTIVAISSIAIIIGIHFIVRRMVLKSMLDKLEIKLPTGMSLVNSLKHNARMRHSIFRPNPVGWNIFQKLRLNSISNKLESLYEKLSNVMSHYSEDKKRVEV